MRISGNKKYYLVLINAQFLKNSGKLFFCIFVDFENCHKRKQSVKCESNHIVVFRPIAYRLSLEYSDSSSTCFRYNLGNKLVKQKISETR